MTDERDYSAKELVELSTGDPKPECAELPGCKTDIGKSQHAITCPLWDYQEDNSGGEVQIW